MLNERRTCLAVLSLLTTFVQHVTPKGCTGNQPLVSGFHFSVLDYQMWSNSNDTNSYPGSAFGEDSDTEKLISYEGRIGTSYYRGWCSEFNPTVQPFLQIDFKREVIIRQVETQGVQLNYPVDDARYIRGFWLEYSTNTTASFVNVTELNSNVTKVFSGQDDNNHAASVVQHLPQPITATVVRIYPIVADSVPNTRACLKLELHGCVPQREEECHSVYPLSCCSYGQPGDMISSVEVTSDDPTDSKPGPVTDILSYYDSSKFWCGNRNILPAIATFHFTEEVLLTSVAFHGFDGPLGDDYVTQYSWEYSVGNSTVKTYTDLGNNTIFENNREDKFQQTFWTPIHVQTLKFVAHARAIRPCMAFQFFGCKLNEVISISQVSNMSLSPTTTSDASSTTQQLSSDATSIAISTPSVLGAQCSTVTVTSTVTPTVKMTSSAMVTSTSTSTPTESPTPSPRGSVTKCIGDEEPLISGTRYYVNNNQLSASGHDPLHYTYDNMNERVLLVPAEGRINNDYGSFLGWCSQIITNIMDNTPYIQVEFDIQVVVSTVAVQGIVINGDKRQPRYVRKFHLAYKDLESEKFCTINDENGLPMNFTGNSDTNYLEIMKSSLNKHVSAKVFRLYPRNWTSKAVINDKIVNISRACLKWELYGCADHEIKTGVNNSCYPHQNLLSPSDIVNITSNSRNTVVTTSLFRLIDSTDNWCPSTEDINLPLVIDFYFAEVTVLTSVAMAGRKTTNGDHFVSSYSLSYVSNASCNLTLYEDLTGHSIFYNDHVRTFFHSFWEPIRVRRLQLLILDWYINPCISIGFFGCTSSDVNFNFTASTEMTGSPSQDVCIVPANNVLLSCVNEDGDSFMASSDNSDSNYSVITIVFIIISLTLASLLLIIMIVLLYRRYKTKLRSAKLHFAVRNPMFMQLKNPLYESSKTKTDGNYNVCFNRDQVTIKLLDDDQSQHYSKLQHRHREDDGASSSNPYDVLQPQPAQGYAQEGPKESDSNATYEEILYHEIISKSDENQ